VVEIVDLFAIRDVDPQAVRGAAQSLLVSKKYTALIKLFTIFSSLEWSIDATIRTMTKSKDWSAAELFARTFGGPEENGSSSRRLGIAVVLEVNPHVSPPNAQR
jgi:hypothetical protein